jgi:hypothetical protein
LFCSKVAASSNAVCKPWTWSEKLTSGYVECFHYELALRCHIGSKKPVATQALRLFLRHAGFRMNSNVVFESRYQLWWNMMRQQEISFANLPRLARTFTDLLSGRQNRRLRNCHRWFQLGLENQVFVMTKWQEARRKTFQTCFKL